ncbi:MAG: glycosyltransferase family 4 protein [candidate division WOR-3 bacterium]
MKIIQILTHSPSWVTKNIEEDIYDGWHVRTAKAIKKISNNFDFVCILPEKNVHQIITEQKEGITYQVFPSIAFSYQREISLPMIRAIKAMAKEPIILHLHGAHNYLTYTLTSIFAKLPIVIQHHGDCPPFNLIERRHRLIFFISLLGMEQFLMYQVLRFVDFFFVLTNKERERLLKFIKPEKIKIQGMGVDFNYFLPMKKDEARRRLNLSPSEKILLYVGKLQRYKGCDVALEVYQELKKEYNIKLLLVGGSETDELYGAAKASQAVIFPRQPPELMPTFYSAADVTILPGTKPLTEWGGIGISLIESLACGTPVVGGTLRNFWGEISRIGVLAVTKREIIEGVKLILNNPEKFHHCRTEAQRYYNWQVIAQNTIAVYQKLARKYYPTALNI